MPDFVKPAYRGLIHQHACWMALLAGVALVALAPSGRPALAASVYALSLVAMFGVSAIYHRVHWTPRMRHRLRRLDHAAIFVLIAGSYTPFCLLALRGETGSRLLLMAWVGALAGIVQSVLWVGAPRLLTAFLYLTLGWLVAPYLPLLAGALGPTGLGLLGLAGLLFTGGALVYVLRRPNPAPRVFGYHEVFHSLITAACACKFAAVALLIMR